LLPITLVKPHIGFPIALIRLTWRRAAACAIFGLSTLLLDPTWPMRWLNQVDTYDGFIPVLTPLGVLLLIAIVRWRQKQVRLFLLLMVAPQRLFYDQLLIWLLPQSLRESLMLVCLSWLGYFGFYMTGRAAEIWVTATLFLPVLVIVMRHSAAPEQTELADRPNTGGLLGSNSHDR
jgi:hypothetical protein